MKLNNHILRWPELSARAYNILCENGIDTVEKLAAIEERRLREFRNCGRTTIYELRAFLQKRGLDLANPVDSQTAKLKKQVEELARANAAKDAEILQLKTELDRIARLPLANDLVDRLEIQVDRFEQLMSKIFRKERREALLLEIEKLDNGELP
jgi:Bacterial RNA polymerase, alpha chain C terminal domain